MTKWLQWIWSQLQWRQSFAICSTNRSQANLWWEIRSITNSLAYFVTEKKDKFHTIGSWGLILCAIKVTVEAAFQNFVTFYIFEQLIAPEKENLKYFFSLPRSRTSELSNLKFWAPGGFSKNRLMIILNEGVENANSGCVISKGDNFKVVWTEFTIFKLGSFIP